ncbi:MAG TPA: hypothetical protein VFX48_06495 [Saprospiraceae bacterium]|nr:hypothetical protein [Saprospiraceae bacterium]
MMFMIFLIIQDSSGARSCNSQGMAIQVTAPPDITIQISDPLLCDTTIRIMSAMFLGNCSPNLSFTTESAFDSLTTNGGSMYFRPGIFKVVFTVTDDCRMSGRDSMYVTVYDAELPNAICRPQQTINLPGSGFADIPAIVFDGGSSDYCGQVYFKIKRRFLPAGYSCHHPSNPAYGYDDELRFCCEDVDSPSIQVILRVYDLFPGNGVVPDSLHRGHFAQCTTSVIVRDKIGPDLVCPYDLTVSCGADLDSIWDQMDPIIQDNCGIRDVDTSIQYRIDACGSGTAVRTFTATDLHGQSASCQQTITVYRVRSFDGLDPNQLHWPDHATIYACRIDTDTLDAGIPEISEDACANVQVSHQDERYAFSRGGVCVKILRNWKVIDWCRYNPMFSPDPRVPQNGYYTYIQEIKIIDTIAPVISGVRDTVMGIQTGACQPGMIVLPDVQAEDCGSTGNIDIRYEIDYHSDGQVDASADGNNASGLYPIGRHVITFYALDSCRNEGSLNMLLEVFDAKSPNAIAIYGLSTSLIQMAAGPMVGVPARLFDNKSSDNCTTANRLRFSYSADPNDTLRIFNCDSIGRRVIHLFVWDEQGNSSEVITFLEVEDVDHLCPTSLHGVHVLGAIRTRNHQIVGQAEVRLEVDQAMRSAQTNDSGEFEFSDVPKFRTINIHPVCQDKIMDGISTADIIAIQSHILGLKPFSNPFDLLAADVDFSGGITSKDISLIRNMILGRTDALPHKKSFVFVDRDYQFTNAGQPFSELDSCGRIVLRTREDSRAVEFTAVKLGDLNQSYSHLNLKIPHPEQIQLKYRLIDGYLECYPASEWTGQGFQLGLELKGWCVHAMDRIESTLPSWDAVNYRIDGNQIRMTYHATEGMEWHPSVPLIRIPVERENLECESPVVLVSGFQSEAYSGDRVLSISRIFEGDATEPKDELQLSVYPNPFQQHLQLKYQQLPGTGFYLELYDVNQRMLFKKYIKLQSDSGELTIPRNAFGTAGIYLMHIYNESFSRHFSIFPE